LQKNCTLKKSGQQFKKKSSTLGKELRTWKSAAHLEKSALFRKMRHTWKNAPHLEKWFTVGKIAAHMEI